MEAALVLVRLGQYLGAAGLFGAALFLARQSRVGARAMERGLLLGSSLVLLLSTAGALILQSAAMAGASDPFSDPSMVGMVVTGTSFGYAVVARLLFTFAAAVVLLASRRPALWAVAALGAGATLSLAWGGHGAGDEGVPGLAHLGADVIHLLAAALWLGALAALVVLSFDSRAEREPAIARRLHAALNGFSGAGTLAVGLLILTGIVNGWFLVGPTRLGSLPATLYGRLLLTKLALFGAMAALAASNRWRLTPALDAEAPGKVSSAVKALRRSIALESTAGLLVLLAVAWLGTLAPPGAS